MEPILGDAIVPRACETLRFSLRFAPRDREEEVGGQLGWETTVERGGRTYIGDSGIPLFGRAIPR